MTTYRTTLATMLYALEAVKFGAFKLKLHERNPDAPLSPIYFNLRTSDNPKPGPITPLALTLIGRVFQEVVVERRIPHEGVCGIPNAGNPLVDAFMQITPDPKPPVMHLEKTEKNGKRQITRVIDHPHLIPGNVILVMDDVISEADSKIETIDLLRQAGYIVKDVLVIVDREMGGREQLASIGVRLHAVFTIRELLKLYREMPRNEGSTERLVSPEMEERVLTYLHLPPL